MAMYGEEEKKDEKKKEEKPKPPAVQATSTTNRLGYRDYATDYDKRNQADKAAANAEEREKQASKLKEAASKTSGAGMPKQEEGETPAAYGARLTKWREEQRAANANQKKALK